MNAANARGSAIALPELHSGELKNVINHLANIVNRVLGWCLLISSLSGETRNSIGMVRPLHTIAISELLYDT